MSATHGSGENVDASGLVSGHAYSLISIHEVDTENGPVRLCKLRNPWGSGEWKGDWSDESDLWTPELRAEVGCKEEDDGIFHMTVEDYVGQYESTSFCVEHSLAKFRHSISEVKF